MTWKSKQPSLKNSVKKLEMPTDGSWPWRPTLPCTRTNIPMQQELWFSSIGCPKDEEKPLPRLGSPSLKMNTSQTLTRTGPRSGKPSRLHSPPRMQQHRLELPSLCLIKTGRTPQDSISISPSSPSSLSALELLTTMPCHSTPRSWSNSSSAELSKPPPPWRSSTPKLLKSREGTAILPHSGEDPSHHMEEVAVTMTPTLWMWITSCYS